MKWKTKEFNLIGCNDQYFRKQNNPDTQELKNEIQNLTSWQARSIVLHSELHCPSEPCSTSWKVTNDVAGQDNEQQNVYNMPTGICISTIPSKY